MTIPQQTTLPAVTPKPQKAKKDPKKRPKRDRRPAAAEQAAASGTEARWQPTQPRPRRRLAQFLGRYETVRETIFTSTRQAGALNPAIVSTHPPLAGPITGIDVTTGQPVATDPHELYDQGRITSPNVVILGDISSGKSSLAKTVYVTRPVALGRQVAVFDRKLQQGTGEYRRAAELCEVPVIKFARTGGTSINLLDPRIATTSLDAEENSRVGQDRLLLMVAEHAHGALDSREHYALRTAHSAALDTAASQGRTATIHDVVNALYNPGEGSVPRPHLDTEGIVTRSDLITWGLDLALDLDRFITGDLSGLLDRETSEDMNLDAPLLVFDTSALPEESPALALVMALVSTFLASVWSLKPGKRIIVLEEGYHTTRLQSQGSMSVATILRSLAKRGRGIGLAFVTVVHHVSDVPADSDAMSLIREADIVHVFRQSRADDARQVVDLFRFPPRVFDMLGTLAKGVHVVRIGTEPARKIQHIRTRLEEWLTDTDEAMTGRQVHQPKGAA